MKKISLLFVLTLLNIFAAMAQNYRLDYDVLFYLKESGKRYYIHTAEYTTFNNVTKRMPAFEFSQQQSDKLVSGYIILPASEGFIKQIKFNTARQIKRGLWWDSQCNDDAIIFQTSVSSTTCINLTGSSNINWQCLNHGAKITKFECYPVMTISSSKSTMTDNEKLDIQATSGFPSSTYKWKYSTTIYPYTWVDVPSSCYNNDKFSANGEDLLGTAGFLDKLGNNITIGIDLGCGNRLTNVVPISLVRTAPHFVAVATEDVKCPGESNGAIILTLDREPFPGEEILPFGNNEERYNYVTIEGTSLRIDGLPKGTYRVEMRSTIGQSNGSNYAFVSDEAGHKVENIVIGEPDPVSFSLDSQTNALCFGGSDGAFKVTASGGEPPYRLLWKPVDSDDFTEETGLEINGLSAGAYAYYVIDANGCVLKDNEGFPVLQTVELVDPDLLTVTLVEEKTANPSGSGLSNGYITIRVEGGTPAYTVVWKDKNSDITQTSVENGVVDGKFESKLKDIPAGDYTVTVTDANACSATVAIITLEDPFLLKGQITQTASILCNGDETAALSVSASGGIPNEVGDPYLFEWSKFDGTSYNYLSYSSAISNLGPGGYKVLITDGSSPPNTLELFYTISEVDPISVSLSSVNNTCFDGNDGKISVSVSGGTPPYTLYYKKGADPYSQEVSNTGNFALSNLIAGVYSIKVTDINTCPALINGNSEETVTITQPAVTFVVVSQKVKNPSGAGRSDGSITLKVDGGMPFASDPKYTVVCNGPSGSVTTEYATDIDDGLFTSAMKNLPQGHYTIRIYGETNPGSNGPCTLSLAIDLEDPQPLTATWTKIRPVSCNGESDGCIKIIAAGGIKNEDIDAPPYLYAWYKVNEDNSETLIPAQTGDTLPNIGAGRYKVEITDFSSPPNIEGFYYTLTEPAVIAVAVSMTHVSCYGGANGSIKVDVTGGTAPYFLYYKVKDAEGDYTELSSTNGAFTINNLVSGDYDLYVSDKNACPALINGNPIETLTITQPEKAMYVVSHYLLSPSGEGRNDGLIILKIAGGTPFPTGDLYSVSWKDEDNATLSANNYLDADTIFTTEVSNLRQGEYTVIIRDKNSSGTAEGCYLTFVFHLEDPGPMSAYIEQTKTVDCFGDFTGELVAHVSGGFANPIGMPYKYTWYKMEGDELIILNAENDSILSNLGVGLYFVQVDDYATPTNSAEEDLFFEITQPPLLETQLATQDISCYDGRNGFIHLSVTGGVEAYSFYYQQGQDAFLPLETDSTAHDFALDDLYSGDYSVYVLDANGCYAKIEDQEIARITLLQPDSPLAIDSAALIHPSKYQAANGSVNLRISGGTPLEDGAYTVIWRNSLGETLVADNFVADGATFVSELTGLSDGTYTVEIRDANYYDTEDRISNEACIVIESFTLIEPEEFKGEVVETPVTCFGTADGKLTSQITGGVVNPDESGLPYQYQWYKKTDDGEYQAIEGANDSELSALSGGEYRLIVEDYSWLTNTLTFDYHLVEPALLTISAADVHVVCGQTADIATEVSGGTAPYAYQWSNGDETPGLSEMYPGIYMVFVSDTRGCTATTIAKIISPSDLTLVGEASDPLCYQGSNGNVVTAVSGGTAPYSYRWSNGSTDKDLKNVGAGTYTVVVTDQDGCSFSESFTLNDPEPAQVDLGDDKIICLGQSHQLSPAVEDPATQFAWTSTNGFTSSAPEVSLDRTGDYYLTITDSKGCRASDEIHIEVKDYQISSEIVVATQTVVNDTIVFVNISDPEPDRIEWLIPEDAHIEVVETGPELALVIFRQIGNYAIGMRSYVADCFQDVVKTISVTEQGEPPMDELGPSDIKRFIVYPNPSTGVFTVDVELEKAGTIRLRLINLSLGVITSNKTWSGSDKYSLQYNETLSPGGYILALETATSQRSLKIMIH
ncbi:MAG: hypothetical protein LBU22_07445 [Dysgonamonadaceae bacterium]|jgi:hypothetical protein|nr:hypothetical protein [Dysgonamonadaceae bacterium]